MERDLNSMAQRKKRLLILGSGFGGLRLYTTIYKEYDTLLVDRKNYFEFAPQILSCFEKPERLKKIVIELDSNIRVGDFLHGSLVVVGNHSSLIQPWDIEKTTIRLNNRGWPFQVRYPNDPTQQNQTPVLEIVFDYCVIALGGKYPQPIGSFAPYFMTRRLEVENAFNMISSGNFTGVSILGGGYVGVETACYVKKILGQKGLKTSVRIFNRGPIICKNVNDKARVMILEELQKKRIEVFVNKPTTKEDCARRGELAIDCTGTTQKENIPYYDSSFKLTEEGFLVVNDYLQVVQTNGLAYQNIFGVGDCVQTLGNSAKLGFIAMLQAEYLRDLLMSLHNMDKKRCFGHVELLPRDFNKIESGENPVMPALEQLGLEGYSKVHEPHILLVSLGDDVMLVTKTGATISWSNHITRKFAFKSSMSALRDSFIGKTLVSLSGIISKWTFS